MRRQTHTYPRSIAAEQLAQWIERQPDHWWFVDGDPVLTDQVDFPCPSDELALAIRGVGKDLVLYDTKPTLRPDVTTIDASQVDDLVNLENPRKERTLLCSWSDLPNSQWLLSEDLASVPTVTQP